MTGTLSTAHPPVNDDSTLPEGESLQTIAQVLAVVSLVALVTELVTSHDVFAWVCSGVSAVGVVLLIVDAIRDRQGREGARAGATMADGSTSVARQRDQTERAAVPHGHDGEQSRRKGRNDSQPGVSQTRRTGSPSAGRGGG